MSTYRVRIEHVFDKWSDVMELVDATDIYSVDQVVVEVPRGSGS